jgi:hypothetical protein
MKVIFPSFAWFALAAVVACAQTDLRLPAMSIPPQEAVASPAGAAGGLPSTAASSPSAASTNVSGGTANNSGPANGAELFIQRVAAAADQLQSVQARIRYHTNLFGQQTVGAGIYLQQGLGSERKFRLELKTAIGQQLLTLEQVCDGKYLWQYHDSFKPNSGKTNHDAPERPIITRVDLVKVRQTLEDADHSGNMNVISQLAVGGLPKLLNGLEHSFRYSRVEAGRLDTMPVWIAAGSWLPEAISPVSKQLADQAAHEQPLNLKLLPPQLPEQVWLYLGQDDLFPYRMEYRRRAGTQGRGGGAGQEEMLPIVTVEFYEVRLNSPINPREFDYQPGNADILDTTANFLKELQGK